MIGVDAHVELEEIKVFTDGAINNVALDYPLGGWGFWIPELGWAQGGACSHTTSNQMELYGAVAALTELYKHTVISYWRCPFCAFIHADNAIMEQPCCTNMLLKPTSMVRKQHCLYPVVVHSDSEYVCKGFNEYLLDWKLNGWKTKKDDEPVKNQQLWKWLHRVGMYFDVRFEWVKGHAGTFGNEVADYLAGRAIKENLCLLKPDTKVKIKSPPVEGVKIDLQVVDFTQGSVLEEYLEGYVGMYLPALDKPKSKMLFA